MYVPEVHPVTGIEFCEWEDEGHIFKVRTCDNAGYVIICMYLQRIGNSLRQGGPRYIKLEHFKEALHDTTAGLTYCALSGIRKQNVEDVERLFGLPLIMWMESKRYNEEATYL